MFVELIRRLRALTLTLLPLEVDPAVVNDPTSRIITPQVIVTYMAAAGDFVEAVSSSKGAVEAILNGACSCLIAFSEQGFNSCGMRTITQPIMARTLEEVRHNITHDLVNMRTIILTRCPTSHCV